jgi:hypothetical protein
MDEQPKSPTRSGPRGAFGRLLRRPRMRIGAVIAIAVAAGVIAWVVVDSQSSTSSSAPTTAVVTKRVVVAMSPEGLKNLSAALHHPIYWVGTKSRYTYEVTETPNGNIYVRYLPPGVKVGNDKPNYLIIGTYPFQGSFAALKRTAHGNELKLPGGGIAVVDQAYPKSVHLSWPGVDFQVEVYDPSPQRSLSIALSGNVRPVG